jgi:hypothetical protein
VNQQTDASRYSCRGAKETFGSSLATRFHLEESEHVDTAWNEDNIFALTRVRADTGSPDRTTLVPRDSALNISVAVMPVPLTTQVGHGAIYVTRG